MRFSFENNSETQLQEGGLFRTGGAVNHMTTKQSKIKKRKSQMK